MAHPTSEDLIQLPGMEHDDEDIVPDGSDIGCGSVNKGRNSEMGKEHSRVGTRNAERS